MRHDWDTCSAFVFDDGHGIRATLKRNDVAIVFTGGSQNSFLSGVFVLPIGNLACSPTHVV